MIKLWAQNAVEIAAVAFVGGFFFHLSGEVVALVTTPIWIYIQ